MSKQEKLLNRTISTEAELDVQLLELKKLKEKRRRREVRSSIRARIVLSISIIVLILASFFIPGFKSIFVSFLSNSAVFGVALAISFREFVQAIRQYKEYKLENSYISIHEEASAYKLKSQS